MPFDLNPVISKSELNLPKHKIAESNIAIGNEKAIIFKDLKKTISSVGLDINTNFADPNCVGYATIYFLDNYPRIVKGLYLTDKYIFSKIIPKLFAPFEYMIVNKSL